MKHILMAVAVAVVVCTAQAATKVAFFFDTEDYTCDRSNDAIRDIANILKSEGVKGNFNIAGYLGARLVELGRHDVIEALRHQARRPSTIPGIPTLRKWATTQAMNAPTVIRCPQRRGVSECWSRRSGRGA